MIEVNIIKDSVGPNGSRLTTFLLKYPRFIHQEVLTHRALSRNSSSSRAIPVKKQVKATLENMAVPIHIGAKCSGMQAKEEVPKWKQKVALFIWKAVGYVACYAALFLDKLGVHKQVTNRIFEPWTHITVVASATDWDNFFALRYHEDAQPEIYELAKKMYEAMQASTPRELKAGEWHLPFVEDEELNELGIDKAIRVSVARCARTSYNNFDGNRSTWDKDIGLYKRLIEHNPLHSSPAEHPAMAVEWRDYTGNFYGWLQHRKTLVDECVYVFSRKE